MSDATKRYWSWRSTTSVAGLGLGMLGILLQFVGDPRLFGGFPPGVWFLAAAGVLVVVTRRWWCNPVFAVLIAAWVTLGGLAGGQLGRNIASGDALVSGGAIVLQVGLATAVVLSVLALAHNLGVRRRVSNPTAPAPGPTRTAGRTARRLQG